MLEEAFKESTDIQTCEIASAKPKIKGQASSFGGHRKTTEGRNSVLLIEMVKERRLPLGGPGTSDIRNKQKPGFIEEDQMGPKSFGFFYMGPAVTLPMGNLFFVPLQGSTLGFLTTPSQA